VLALLSLGLAACQPGPASLEEAVPQIPPTQQAAWYSLYITQALPSGSKDYHGGPDEDLAQAIRQARSGVDVAAYSFNLWSLRDALLDAQRRGVTVRMVVESDSSDSPELQELKDAGLQVLGDRREGLMHNKFAILDRQEVWSGSLNFTTSGAYHADNNLIRLRSPQLAEDYLAEFEEMFLDDQFGPGSPANTPRTQVDVGGTQVEVYFSPEDGTPKRLLELIDGAQLSIAVMMNSFTSDDLANALIRRAKEGVQVRIVLDDAQAKSDQGSEYPPLKQAGMNVHLDGSSTNMHHKVMVIDGEVVVTGSYNFSANAALRNDENTLVIHNPEIASRYLAEFERLYQAGVP
jgi:phosphatidylserine/phosphatidylglycerophosphate/cardiolipin synthase-like enzyme